MVSIRDGGGGGGGEDSRRNSCSASGRSALEPILGSYPAVEFRPNLLDDDVTGVVVDFCGLQIDTFDPKSTQCEVINEQIRPKFHSLVRTCACATFLSTGLYIASVISFTPLTLARMDRS